MRLEFSFDEANLSKDEFETSFNGLTESLGASWEVHYRSRRLRMGILCSKEDHCLLDLLHRHHSGELAVEIVGPGQIAAGQQCVQTGRIDGPAAMDVFEEMAREFSIYCIEDACQSLGARLGARDSGSFGNCGFTSFYPSKPLGGIGELAKEALGEGKGPPSPPAPPAAPVMPVLSEFTPATTSPVAMPTLSSIGALSLATLSALNSFIIACMS